MPRIVTSEAVIRHFLEGKRFWHVWEQRVRTAAKNLVKDTSKEHVPIDVDFSAFTPETYLLSWATIVGGVEPEKNGYWIRPAHSKWVNDNGNCVVGNTRVLTSKGFLEIQDLCDYSGDILTEFGSKNCGGVIFSGEKQVLTIRTNWGSYLHATEDHRIKIVDVNGEICWRAAKDLNVGDSVLFVKGSANSLPENRGQDPLSWEMIGRFYGDGSYSANGKSFVWFVPETEGENLASLEKYLQSLGYSRKLSLSQGGGRHNYELEKCYTVQLRKKKNRKVRLYYVTTSIPLLREIIPTYEKKGNWRNIGVPALLWKEGKQQIVAYLRGLFSTDGGCSSAKERKRGGQISFSTKRREIAYQARKLLRLLGIVSAVSKRAYVGKTGDSFERKKILRRYVVVLRGFQSKQIFSELVGFSVLKKTQYLQKLLGRKNKLSFMGYPNVRSLITKIFPYGTTMGKESMRSLGSLIRSIRVGRVNTLTEDRYVPFLKLAATYGRCEQSLNKIKEFFDNKCYVEEIVKISYGDVTKVYDVVNSETSSYVSDGFVSHNCWLNQVLLESYKSFIWAENYLEHLQLTTLSKGKILDAVAWVVREHEPGRKELLPTVFIDILVATNRKKHPELVQKIQSGKLSGLSMGCQITHSQCSRCGEIFEEGEDEQCIHLKEQLGQYFRDEKGRKHRVAELCGVPGKAGSCCFNEACVVGDTRVLTREGIFKISDLSNVPFSIVTEYGVKESEGVVCWGEKPVWEVKTKSGNRIKVTENHKFKVLERRGSIVWKPLNSLERGDYILSQRGDCGVLQENKGRSFEFWVALGLFYGDGSYQNQGDQIRWQIPEGEEETLVLLEDWLGSQGYKKVPCDGRPVDYISKKYTVGLQEPQSDEFRNGTKKVYVVTTVHKEMMEVLPIYQSEGNWRNGGVPISLWMEGKCQIAGFLKGLFSSDGYACATDSHAGFITKRFQLARDAKQLLLALGVVSTLRDKKVSRNAKIKGKGGFSVDIINRRSRVIYQEKISYTLNRKRSAMERALKTKGKTERQGFPFAQEIIKLAYPGKIRSYSRSDYVASGIRQVRDGRTLSVSDSFIPGLLERAEREGNEVILKSAIVKYAANRWWFDKVVDIKEMGREKVYDPVNVAETESYISNGLVSHNSWVGIPAWYPAVRHGNLRVGDEWIGRPLRAKVPKSRIEEAAKE